MHSTAEREAAIRKFKERKPRLGVFAVRCTAAAQTWVGSARNLDATKKRFWFCLRSGVHPDKSLQCEWNIPVRDSGGTRGRSVSLGDYGSAQGKETSLDCAMGCTTTLAS